MCWDQRAGQRQSGWDSLQINYHLPFLVDLLALISEALSRPPNSFIRTAIAIQRPIQAQLALPRFLPPAPS